MICGVFRVTLTTSLASEELESGKDVDICDLCTDLPHPGHRAELLQDLSCSSVLLD